MTLKDFVALLNKNYEELVAKGKEDYHFFLKNAYEYAHYNEVVDYFENLDEEDWKNDWEELVGEREGNVLTAIWNTWLNYNHPEYYNFFCYEGLVDILKYYFEHH